jgi:hypothetical protein
MKVDRELRRDRPATAPCTSPSQLESFEASLHRFRKRDRESELTSGDPSADLPKTPAPSATIEAPPLPPNQAAFRFRWIGTPASRCLEVIHARSGTRFVLSRDGSAWLLAIESDSAPGAAALARLNETFTTLGLGPIDVIAD